VIEGRTGHTLLELTLAMTLLTAMVVAVGIVLRTGHAAWSAHHDDAARIAAANTAVRHVARRVRQAQAVTAISAPDDTSGTISLLMPSGETLVWAHDAGAQEVRFGVGSADDLLAEGVTELSFVGYQADAVTQTAVPAEVRSVKCRVGVQLQRETGGDRSVSCWAWLRSW
jgi:hypothetical protein